MNSSSEPFPVLVLACRWNIATPASRSQSRASFRNRCGASRPERRSRLPDPAELLAARIEEERRAITAQARQEASGNPARPCRDHCAPSSNLPSSATNISARPRPKSSASRWPSPAASSIAKPRSIRACLPVWSTTNSSNWKPQPACASFVSPDTLSYWKRSRPRPCRVPSSSPPTRRSPRAMPALKPLSVPPSSASNAS